MIQEKEREKQRGKDEQRPGLSAQALQRQWHLRCSPKQKSNYSRYGLLLLLLLLRHFSRVRLCVTHGLQPTRLLHPWDSPGKNTGVGCHFLLQCMKVKSLSRVRLLATPQTAAYQAPPSMGFSRQEYWSGLPLPSPRCGLDKV